VGGLNVRHLYIAGSGPDVFYNSGWAWPSAIRANFILPGGSAANYYINGWYDSTQVLDPNYTPTVVNPALAKGRALYWLNWPRSVRQAGTLKYPGIIWDDGFVSVRRASYQTLSYGYDLWSDSAYYDDTRKAIGNKNPEYYIGDRLKFDEADNKGFDYWVNPRYHAGAAGGDFSPFDPLGVYDMRGLHYQFYTDGTPQFGTESLIPAPLEIVAAANTADNATKLAAAAGFALMPHNGTDADQLIDELVVDGESSGSWICISTPPWVNQWEIHLTPRWEEAFDDEFTGMRIIPANLVSFAARETADKLAVWSADSLDTDSLSASDAAKVQKFTAFKLANPGAEAHLTANFEPSADPTIGDTPKPIILPSDIDDVVANRRWARAAMDLFCITWSKLKEMPISDDGTTLGDMLTLIKAGGNPYGLVEWHIGLVDIGNDQEQQDMEDFHSATTRALTYVTEASLLAHPENPALWELDTGTDPYDPNVSGSPRFAWSITIDSTTRVVRWETLHRAINMYGTVVTLDVSAYRPIATETFSGFFECADMSAFLDGCVPNTTSPQAADYVMTFANFFSPYVTTALNTLEDDLFWRLLFGSGGSENMTKESISELVCHMATSPMGWELGESEPSA
jgi:hypothetical protein